MEASNTNLASAAEPAAAPPATAEASKAPENSRFSKLALSLGASILAFAVCAPAVFGVSFYTKGEPREALVVQAITQNGAVILPYRNGDEIPSKPPFFHWMGSAVSLVGGGVSEASVRAPSLMAATAAVVATVLFAARWFSLATALVAGAVLLTSFQWAASATTARVDMVLAGFISLGLFAYFRAYAADRPTPATVWACAAAATLTKGPVGLALPGAIVFAHLSLRRDWHYLLRRINLPAALVALLAVCAWYGAATWVGGQPFLDKLILKENVLRVLDGAAGKVGHLHPFYWYIPTFFAGAAPWSLFLPFGLMHAARLARNESIESSRADPSRFLLLWLGLTLAIFSLADSKRGVYLLPAYPAAAILMASGIAALLGQARRFSGPSVGLTLWLRTTLGLLGLVWALVLLQASGLFSLATFDPLMSDTDQRNLGVIMKMIAVHAQTLSSFAGGYLAFSVIAWRLASGPRQGFALGIVVASLMSTFALGGGIFLREIASHQTLKPFMPEVATLVDDATELYSFPATIYQAVYYAGRPIPPLESAEQARQANPDWVLIARSDLEAFEKALAPQIYRTRLTYLYKDNPRADPLLLMQRSPSVSQPEVAARPGLAPSEAAPQRPASEKPGPEPPEGALSADN